jgi:hypothetical protein
VLNFQNYPGVISRTPVAGGDSTSLYLCLGRLRRARKRKTSLRCQKLLIAGSGAFGRVLTTGLIDRSKNQTIYCQKVDASLRRMLHHAAFDDRYEHE